jgi:hypothetical protein
MFKRMRPRITFSNVIAIMALFFALGGTVYAAAKINGKQIKSNSIPGNRVKKNSLTSKQIKDKTLKAVGSAAALNNVTYQTQSAALPAGGTSLVTATATCPAGLKLLGGGGTLGRPDLNFIQDVGPVGNNAYRVTAFPDPGTPDTLTATAICTSVSSTTP